ncbi:MAG: hypothetical protein Q8911_14270, partial [Bacillota bacterium]|nr:hypothetical protein [Bacillota bacterium]
MINNYFYKEGLLPSFGNISLYYYQEIPVLLMYALTGSNHTNFMKTLKRFFIYGIIGLVLEVIYTGVASLIKGDYSMQGFTF